MKNLNVLKKFIPVICFIFVSSCIRADQLAYITKEQAQKATDFLRKQKEVLLWCACCDENNPKQILRVSNVHYESANSEQFYKVILEGIDKFGNTVTEELDLAYIYFRKGEKAFCVGKKLGYKCNPCKDRFLWGT